MMLGATAFTSCTDANDWGTDSSTNRMFSPTGDITLDRYDTKVGVSFKPVSGASGYQVELSKDSLYLDEVSESSIVQIFKTADDTIRGLSGETKYFLRVRTLSDNKPSSKWLYYKTGSGKYYFTTLAEQLFFELTNEDITENAIHTSWVPGSEVTHIVILANGEEVSSYQLTDQQKAEGKFDVVGLAPTTTYTIQLFNGDVKRGSLSVTTPVAMPTDGYTYELPSDITVLTKDMMEEIAAEAIAAGADPANYSVVIGIPAGITFDIHGTSDDGSSTSVRIPDGMSVTFFGHAGGDRPVLNLSKSVDIRGSHGFVRFHNIEIKDGGCQYFINQSASCTLGELSFDDIHINGMSRSLVRFQSSDAKSVEKLIVDNCIIGDQGNGGYALIYANNAAYTIGSISITNSTFFKLQHNFIQIPDAQVNTVDVKDCTFYNIIGGGRYFIDAQNKMPEINVENVILAKTFSTTAKGIRSEGEHSVINTIATSDFVISSNKIKGYDEFDGKATDLLKDPENGDYTLKVTSIKSGDPRWIPEEE